MSATSVSESHSHICAERIGHAGLAPLIMIHVFMKRFGVFGLLVLITLASIFVGSAADYTDSLHRYQNQAALGGNNEVEL